MYGTYPQPIWLFCQVARNEKHAILFSRDGPGCRAPRTEIRDSSY